MEENLTTETLESQFEKEAFTLKDQTETGKTFKDQFHSALKTHRIQHKTLERHHISLPTCNKHSNMHMTLSNLTHRNTLRYYSAF